MRRKHSLGKLSFRSLFSPRWRLKKRNRLRRGARVSRRYSKTPPDSPVLLKSTGSVSTTNSQPQIFSIMRFNLIFRLTVFAFALGAVIALAAGCGRAGAQVHAPAPSVTVAPVEQ